MQTSISSAPASINAMHLSCGGGCAHSLPLLKSLATYAQVILVQVHSRLIRLPCLWHT